MNSETKCPLTPCPSQTPKRYRPLFIKFYIVMKVSWLTLFFFSGQNPQRLPTAYLVIKSSSLSYGIDPFLPPYSASNLLHYFWLVFKFYWDLALPCFGLLLLLCFFLWSLWSLWDILLVIVFRFSLLSRPKFLSLWGFRQLIVFLWSFFFFSCGSWWGEIELWIVWEL